MDYKDLIKPIYGMAIQVIFNLICSKVVPAIKRKAYEQLNEKADDLIFDLAQNAGKIKNESDELKKLAYIEGTKLGVETLRAIATKLNQASDEIEKVLQNG